VDLHQLEDVMFLLDAMEDHPRVRCHPSSSPQNGDSHCI
jgi:hypothetical protein